MPEEDKLPLLKIINGNKNLPTTYNSSQSSVYSSRAESNSTTEDDGVDLNLEENTEMKRWLRKRRISTYICIAYGFLIGIEYSCIVASLPFYLKEDVKIDHPKKWYSVIMTMTAASGAINGVLAGKFIDKTRRLKLSMALFTAVSAAGNLMYSFQSSIWFLIVGRLLCGACEAAQPVISGNFK